MTRFFYSLTMVLICWAISEAAEPPKPEQKPISEMNRLKLENVSLKFGAAQLEIQKLQAEANKLIEAACTEAGYKADECQPDLQAGVVKRVPKEAAKPPEKK